MSEFPRRRWTFRGGQTQAPPPRPTQEEITPDSAWTLEPNLHTLLIDLPGFKESDIKLRIDKPSSINVSGERVTRDNKRIHFNRAFLMPADADTDNITMRLQQNVLNVFVPRVPKDKSAEAEIKDEKKEPELPKEEKKKEPEMPKEEEKKQQPEMPKVGQKEEPEMPKEEQKEKQPEMPKDEQKEGQKEKLQMPKEEVEQQPEMPKEDLQKEPEKPEEPEKPQEDAQKEPEKIEEKKEEPEEEKNKAEMMPKEEIVQKTTADEKKEESIPKQEERIDDKKKEESSQKSVIGKISEQKGILLASIISFTLGFLLSKRFQPHPHN